MKKEKYFLFSGLHKKKMRNNKLYNFSICPNAAKKKNKLIYHLFMFAIACMRNRIACVSVC